MIQSYVLWVIIGCLYGIIKSALLRPSRNGKYLTPAHNINYWGTAEHHMQMIPKVLSICDNNENEYFSFDKSTCLMCQFKSSYVDCHL